MASPSLSYARARKAGRDDQIQVVELVGSHIQVPFNECHREGRAGVEEERGQPPGAVKSGKGGWSWGRRGEA